MLEKFNIGDNVCVVKAAAEYGAAYGGKVGVIERVSNYHGKYGVALIGLHNDFSENGLFWFSEESLVPQIEKAQTKVTKAFYEKLCEAFNLPSPQVEIKKVIFNNPATIVFWSDEKKDCCKMC